LRWAGLTPTIETVRRLLCAAAAAVSLALLAPPAAGGEGPRPLTLENFASGPVFLGGWKIKKWKGVVGTRFASDAAGPFLNLTADKSSWAFLKNLENDIVKIPVLAWSWRVSSLPPGGDGRKRETDDEAAQVYVFFPGKGLFPKLDPRIVGYTWETVPPKGTFYHSPKNDSTRVTVLRSGGDALDTWCAERRNVREDFRTAFGAEAPPPICVCIQIDSDDTGSRVESAFRDLRLEPAP